MGHWAQVCRSGFRLLVPRRDGNYGNWKLNNFNMLQGAKSLFSPLGEEKTGNCLLRNSKPLKNITFQFPCIVNRKVETGL